MVCLVFLFPLASLARTGSLIVATTTSIQDCGLLDVLIPTFQKKTGYLVKVIPCGSGQAMVLGRRGEADVLLVHSPSEETRFMEEGFGLRRRLVMCNYFLIVGPAEDPARVNGSSSAVEAMRRIFFSSALFLSRGDNSGTHIKEMGLWREAGVDPRGKRWYQETGLGMGQTLAMASDKRGYTICDSATYLSMKRHLESVVLFKGDPLLINVYHVIEVSNLRWPKVNERAARTFSDYLLYEQTQSLIGKFGLQEHGSPLFFPMSRCRKGSACGSCP